MPNDRPITLGYVGPADDFWPVEINHLSLSVVGAGNKVRLSNKYRPQRLTSMSGDSLSYSQLHCQNSECEGYGKLASHFRPPLSATPRSAVSTISRCSCQRLLDEHTVLCG